MDEIPPEIPGYRLTRRLGAGATSQVWRARRDDDDELVAIKVLPGEADEAAVREFALLQQAAHEHVVTLHETIALERPQGPATALVLELLAGGSLEQVVAARGHLSPGETVTVLAPIAQALHGLHDRGIVHGDLSPGNVLLTSTGRPALSDLGFSRLTGEPPGEVHGTDGYVAPEVLEGREPSRASDIHALGALGWLCLTGAPPGHVIERTALLPHAPDAPELVDVIERCLTTSPACRPEAAEVARASFDAVPPEAIRMTSPGDVASSLTRRIRDSAAQSTVLPQWQQELMTASPPRRTPRWWQRRVRAKGATAPTRSPRHAAPKGSAVSAAKGPDRAPESREGALSTPRAIARDAVRRARPGRMPVLLALGVGVALAALVPWQLASAGDVREETTASTSSVRLGADDAGADAVRTDRSAPQNAPTPLARELTAMRERMVGDRDPAVLERLDEPGSPAAERDRELLASLTASDRRYRDVDLSVRSAHLERSQDGVVVLRTTSDTSAYTIVGPQGEQQRPAEHGQRVDLVLVWHDGAWRVRDVR